MRLLLAEAFQDDVCPMPELPQDIQGEDDMIEQQEEHKEDLKEIDEKTAETWVGVYVKDYGELPSETYEKTSNRKLSVGPNLIMELGLALEIRPKFLARVGATSGQIAWLRKWWDKEQRRS